MTDSSNSECIGRLLDDYLMRLRQGQRPGIDEYVQQHPALADEIRQTFSAVLMLQNIESDPGPDRDSRTSDPAGSPVQTAELLRRLGDFRIVREIGRGGMGVVYEAVQESLARTVALKILPRQLFQQPKLVERFQREARAVASLHHTNIVPVFSVGQQDEVFHFAMQFIDGIGVDEVIHRLRDSSSPDIGHEISLIGKSPVGTLTQTATKQAPDLLAETGEHGPATSAEIGTPESDRFSPNPSHQSSQSSASDTANSSHFRKIAQLGLRVADALQHAHDRGILHRDIKPSNLMIDRHGNVWVTDFGLAKIHENNMTQTGDIVGTLQYLPPERLKGTESAAGDVFSLGLTLYELVTLAPAYYGASQADLIAQIMNGTPRRIRDINSRVPRDLETIIHKAMSPEPGMRYASAGMMAGDLDCFLTGRPIRARPTGPLGRAALWARRNPVPAGLLSLVTLLLVALVAGSLFAAFRFANDNRLITEHLHRSIEAEREKGVALLDSKVSQANALMESTQFGRSVAIRDAVTEATSLARDLDLVEENRSRLTQIVLDLSGLLDLEEAKAIARGSFSGAIKQDAAFDTTLSRMARCLDDGEILIDDLNDSSRSFRLSGYWNTDSPHNHPCLLFSPDDSMLAARGLNEEGAMLVQVWDLKTRELLLEEEADGYYLDTAITFVEDDRIAFASAGKCVSLFDIRSGELIWTSQAMAPLVQWLASDKSGDVLVGAEDVVLLTGSSGKARGEFSSPGTSDACAIHPLGRYFALGDASGEIQVWDLSDFSKPVYTLKGHSGRVISLAFHPLENLLMSTSRDGTTRLWDTEFSRPILVAPFGGIRFSATGDRIGFNSPGNRFGFWDLVGLDQTILANGYLREGTIRSIDFSEDSKLVGWASMHRGIVLSETDAPRPRKIFGEYQWASFFSFSKSDRASMVSAGLPTIDRFRLTDRVTDPPEPLSAVVREQSMPHDFVNAPTVVQTASGWFLMGDGRGPMFQFGLNEEMTPLDMPYPTRELAVSADGKWLAFTSLELTGVGIWSLEDQKLIVELPVEQTSQAVLEFDPHNRWLAVSGQGQVVLFDTESWKPLKTIRAIDGLMAGRCAFSADGKLLAVSQFGSVALYGTGDFELIGILSPRNRANIAAAVTTESCPLRFSPDNRFLAAGTHSNTVILWDLAATKEELEKAGLSAW